MQRSDELCKEEVPCGNKAGECYSPSIASGKIRPSETLRTVVIGGILTPSSRSESGLFPRRWAGTVPPLPGRDHGAPTPMPAPRQLTLTDYLDATRWRWVLSDSRGAFLADHVVRLDPTTRGTGDRNKGTAR